MSNRRSKCHYFRCTTNQYRSDDWQKLGVTLHSVPVQSRKEVLELMNIAYYETKIPEVQSIRICSLHFPESAFKSQYVHRGVIRRKLNSKAVPYDWKTLCTKEEIEKIEARTSFRKGDDILEYIEEQRQGVVEGQLAPKIEHDYSQTPANSRIPSYITRKEVELVPYVPAIKIPPGINVEEATKVTRDIHLKNTLWGDNHQSEDDSNDALGKKTQTKPIGGIFTEENSNNACYADEYAGHDDADDNASFTSKHDPEVINEFVTLKEKICRLCGKEDEEMIGIFDILGRQLELPEKIDKAVPINVSEFDELPAQICFLCVSNVDNMYSFYHTVTQTEKKLREIFNIPERPKTPEVPVCQKPQKEDVLKTIMEDAGIGDEFNDEPVNTGDFGFQDDAASDGASDHEHEPEEMDVILEVDDDGDEQYHIAAVEQNKDPAHEATYTTFVCSKCNMIIRSAEEYISHQMSSHGVKVWHCPLCQVFYGNAMLLRQHWYHFHSKSLKSSKHVSPEVQQLLKKYTRAAEKHVCKCCNAEFDDVDIYRIHILEENRKVREAQRRTIPATFKCSYCEEMFTTEKKKEAHMEKTHTEYKPHQCAYCSKKFRLKTSKKHHEDSHKIENTVLCTVCGKLCGSRAYLRAHMRKHMDPVPCKICNKMMIPDRLRTHIKTHKTARPLKCSECPCTFRLPMHLSQHMQSHTDSRFSCSLCNYVTKRKLVMHVHMRRAHAIVIGESLMCAIDDCGMMFPNSSKLYDHICEQHKCIGQVTSPIGDGVDSFFCRYCRGVFCAPATYLTHIRQDHKEIENPIFTCTVCMIETDSLNELSEHLETHPESLRFQCKECPLKFAVSIKRTAHENSEHVKERVQCPHCPQKVMPQNYMDHLGLHKSNKTYTCDVCSRTYVDYYRYFGHRKKHEGSKDGRRKNKSKAIPGECSYCPETFPNQQLLRWHENLHTAPRVFRCESCDYACTNKKSIKQHRKKNHQVEHTIEEEVVAEETPKEETPKEETPQEEIPLEQSSTSQQQYSFFFRL